MNYKDGKWAGQIIQLQHDDGSWGFFHTLSNPVSGQLITTEQALRRLEILGFNNDDKPIKKSVKYMSDCLSGKIKIPDREEKTHNWKVFTELMLSAWIRIFTRENEQANYTAEKWRDIISASFINRIYDHLKYTEKFESILKIKLNPKAGRLVDFSHFYLVSLLTNTLDRKTETDIFKYILEHDNGIFYVYNHRLNTVPEAFQSKQASSYLRAIELLSKYKNEGCKKQLRFAAEWLKKNAIAENTWDMGKQSKDGINLPLSDSWRTDEHRIGDCTYRIGRLMDCIG